MSIVLLLGLFAYLFNEARRTPAIVLVAVYCQYGLEQWMASQYTFFFYNSSLLNIAVGVLVMWGVWIRFKNVGFNLLFQFYPMVGFFSLLLYFYALLTGIWSPALETGEFADQWGKNFLYVIVNVGIAPLLLQRTDELKKVIVCICLVGGAVATYLLFFGEWLARSIVLATGLSDLESLSNPLAIATVGGYAVLACVAYAGAFSNPIHRAVLVVVAVLSLIFIVRTGSRGQLISVLAAALVVWPLAYRVSAKSFFGLALFASILLIAVNWGLQEYWSFSGAETRMSAEAVQDRIGWNFKAVGEIMDAAWGNPLTGIFGLGSISSFTVIGFHSHTAPLEILAEEGILGFAIFVTILILAYVKAIAGFRVIQNAEQRIAFAFFAGVITLEFLVISKEGYLLSAGVFFMNCILLAKFCRIIEREKKKHLFSLRVKKILLENQQASAAIS